MNIKEIVQDIFKKAQSKVRVSCDEYHPHTAMRGCLSGPEDAVALCKLCEMYLDTLEAIENLHKQSTCE